jgi:SpoVK/Ycf46/Vps4 family AAA+-type ATPase
MPHATFIFAAGEALVHVRSVCNIAAMLQPAVVVLEDVDLVFAQRETNLRSATLGTLMDAMDGIADTDDVMFILTTNAIERVESAIKDRPGRISQCIYLGLPSAPLRARYFERLMVPYDTSAVALDRLVRKTDGATQAFIKELVYRAVQVASQDRADDAATLELTDRAFTIALEEMSEGGGKPGLAIIGFERRDAGS